MEPTKAVFWCQAFVLCRFDQAIVQCDMKHGGEWRMQAQGLSRKQRRDEKFHPRGGILYGSKKDE